MMGVIDYAASYFKFKTPTPITGEPTNKALKRLKSELQANASSVETDLGGGDHGYLGLVLTDAEYATVPGTQPFVAPGYPAALTIPPTATAVEALQLREDHMEKKKNYLECKNIEKALQRHVQDALEDKYIEPIVDEYTNLITEDIPTVLKYLFTRYGKIRGEDVTKKDAEVIAMTWLPTEPLVLLTKPIESLKKMAEQANIPFTEKQLIEKGLQIIRNTRDFDIALTEWRDRPKADKTWNNFKLHFLDAQQTLKEVRGPTMQQAGYHHANALASQIRTEFNDRNTEVLSLLQTVTEAVATDNNTPQIESMNNMAQQNHLVQLETMKLLKELQNEFQTLRANIGNNNASENTSGNQKKQQTKK